MLRADGSWSFRPMRARPIRLRAAGFVFAVATFAAHGIARADLWAYVDENGRSHVANHQVDSRYKLFFKGETSLDTPRNVASERDEAERALSGTRLYERATDERVTRRYSGLIDRYARTNGLDPALVKAVVAVESAFDPRAVSAKGAVGLMQVIPETGERYGLMADAHRSAAELLYDPATNLRIGTRYLRDLLNRFDNDLVLALAAYNAGEGSVSARDNSLPPFAETRAYVRIVQQVYALYRPAPPPPRPATVTLPGLTRGATRARPTAVVSH